MTFDPSNSYDENKVVLTEQGEYEGFTIRAYASPDSEGRTWIDGGDTEIGDVNTRERFGSPFPVDIVIEENIYPQEGEIEAIREQLGTAFEEQFDGKVDQVFEQIEDSDDPLETILQMDGSSISEELPSE